MALLTVQLTGICGGGNHLTFVLSGAASRTVSMVRGEVLDPISQEDLEGFCKVIARLAKTGRTFVQARALLQAGVVVLV